MKALLLAPAAEADLGEIWDYSAARWGPVQADRYTDEIRDACLGLADGSRQGREVNLRPTYRKHLTGSHMIYFREQTDRVVVMRILHASRDVERHI